VKQAAVDTSEVLVVGAGPTGLALALSLARFGIRVRVIDKAPRSATTSRALVVHARILEQYAQFGIAQDVITRGFRMEAANLWVAGKRVARAIFGEMGKGLSPFPYAVIFPQDEHEPMLIRHLESMGVKVERPTEFIGFREEPGRIIARLRSASGGEETCEAAFLAGCDGAHSAVREALRVDFPGGTYEHMFYVADAVARGEVMNAELNVALDHSDFLGVFPLQPAGHARLIGTVRDTAAAQHRELSWDDVKTSVMERMGVVVDQVNWFSTYHVHHRVASRFREGRAFLLGDAAHIHSPVGGQGMNTGIGDAFNLGWKLAAVLRGRAAEDLLDSYAPERSAFARRLVASTDRAFTFVTRDGPVARFVRLHLVPRVVPAAFAARFARRLMFRTLSQIGIRYRESPLSEGSAGKIHGGDRLPWVEPDGGGAASGDNFAPLSSLDWQVHVYGEAAAETAASCRARGLELHAFAWRPAMHTAGLERDALYLVRPDGYVAWAGTRDSAGALASYLDRKAIQPLRGEVKSG
jgi:2-polyprenyl-6-methoxyphenol hydroxylase-like FAD-dependent oxidoreductase